MPCVTTNGTASKTSLRAIRVVLGSPPAITACLSTLYCIATGPEARGAIYRRALGISGWCARGSRVGRAPGSGRGCLRPWRRTRITSMPCSTAPSCGPINIAQAPKKSGGRPGHRAQQGRLEHQDSCPDGRLGQSDGCCAQRGAASDWVGADQLLPGLAADALLADKAYDADDRVLAVLAAAEVTAVIPPKCNRVVRREYDREWYQARHLIENFFQKLKQYRAIATRYDKLAPNFLAGIHLASACILLA